MQKANYKFNINFIFFLNFHKNDFLFVVVLVQLFTPDCSVISIKFVRFAVNFFIYYIKQLKIKLIILVDDRVNDE